jgi:hypothetical protein
MQRHNQLTFKLLKNGSPEDIESTFLAEDVLGRIEKTEKKYTKIAKESKEIESKHLM